MIDIRKSLVVSAFLAAAPIAALGMKPSSAEQEPSPASTIASRFPASTETLVVENMGRAERKSAIENTATDLSSAQRPAAAPCVHEHWPYVADECLVAADGAAVKQPARIIRIERRVAGTTGISAN
jgi:hypothetical protein